MKDFSDSTMVADAKWGTAPSALDDADIYGGCFFTPEGTVVVMDNGTNPLPFPTFRDTNKMLPDSSRILVDERPVPVNWVDRVVTTNLENPLKAVTAMGGGSRSVDEAPLTNFLQKANNLNFAIGAMDDGVAKKDMTVNVERTKKRRRGEGQKMSEQQINIRRERNRKHARNSRCRKKALIGSLEESVALLREENEKLRNSIKTHLGDETAAKLLSPQKIEEREESTTSNSSNDNKIPAGPLSPENLEERAELIKSSLCNGNKILDYSNIFLIRAGRIPQQSFIVTDSSHPDNHIVYATQGFLNLTGYSIDQVIGRNCRFLQGPKTDPKALEQIRKGLADGIDMSVCLLNYRADGTTFWNQFFIAALRDSDGNITNHLSVHCEVSDHYAATAGRMQNDMDIKNTLLKLTRGTKPT